MKLSVEDFKIKVAELAELSEKEFSNLGCEKQCRFVSDFKDMLQFTRVEFSQGDCGWAIGPLKYGNDPYYQDYVNAMGGFKFLGGHKYVNDLGMVEYLLASQDINYQSIDDFGIAK